ncbi:MAG: hypothetical protein OEV89_03725 [Desulfobulbaceae bacterium]|nr:hypothetical protein [Desulfobulbaceae bacterium]HIJ89853.1 hypothetical protein [Deltaproteobacteria bacterium]
MPDRKRQKKQTVFILRIRPMEVRYYQNNQKSYAVELACKLGEALSISISLEKRSFGQELKETAGRYFRGVVVSIQRTIIGS